MKIAIIGVGLIGGLIALKLQVKKKLRAEFIELTNQKFTSRSPRIRN